jgi:hypothetical protein
MFEKKGRTSRVVRTSTLAPPVLPAIIQANKEDRRTQKVLLGQCTRQTEGAPPLLTDQNEVSDPPPASPQHLRWPRYAGCGGQMSSCGNRRSSLLRGPQQATTYGKDGTGRLDIER